MVERISRVEEGGIVAKCEDCDGRGEVTEECSWCSGSGNTVDDCYTCDGTGEVDSESNNDKENV